MKVNAAAVTPFAYVAAAAVGAWLVYRYVLKPASAPLQSAAQGLGESATWTGLDLLKVNFTEGGVPYAVGDRVQNALGPGVDSLGTWIYNLFHPGEGKDTSKPQAPAKPYTYVPGLEPGIPWR